MKKLFLLIQGFFVYSFFALPAFAQSAITPQSIDPCTGASGTADMICRLGGDNIANTIRNIIVFFIMLGIVVALLYLLYGGLKWITSGGDKEKVDEARKHIIAAVIGLILIFLAVFILSVILAAFGLSFSDLKIPVIGNITKKV